MKNKVNGKKLAALKVFKKFAIFGFTASAIALIVVAIFSLFPTGGGNFTIRFDDPRALPNVTLSETSDGSRPGTYFLGNPLQKTYQTTLSDVYKKVTDMKVSEVAGSQNIVNEAEGVKYDEALVYTVFISASGDQDETMKVTVNLDGYDLPKNDTTGPLEYLRVLTYVSEISEDKQSESNVKTTVYGAKNIHNLPTVLSNDDYREAVADYETALGVESRTARKATSNLNGQEYCESFLSSNVGEQLVQQELTIQKSKTYRYTFVSYFEGFDQDGYGKAPLETYLLMSVHFGK